MQIINVDCFQPNPHAVELAIQTIQNHGVVVVPTETVYGLVCSVFDAEAVTKIYAIKGRAFTKPLPVFFNSINQIKSILGANNVPDLAVKLFERFAPGPLTIVLNCGDALPESITGKSKTVGIRIPRNPLILDIINKTNLPLASTSANLSDKPSHTDAKEVIAELGDQIDLILDAGVCGSGKPSTVIDLTTEQPKVLREGEILITQINAILGIQNS
ncbi:MAG: L-threonylcarbamoyladenylate synthase [bacterium]